MNQENEVFKKLRPSFAASDWQRGVSMWRAEDVLEAYWEDDQLIQAVVCSSDGRNSYHQSILVVPSTPGVMAVDGRCSCPMEHNCKHVVAACLQAFIQGEEDLRLVATGSHGSVSPTNPEVTPPALRLSHGAQQWLGHFQSTVLAATARPQKPKKALVYSIQSGAHGYELQVLQATLRANGDISKTQPYRRDVNDVLWHPPEFFQDSDVVVFEALVLYRHQQVTRSTQFPLHGAYGYRIVQACLATGRAYFKSANAQAQSQALRPGKPRAGRWEWRNEKAASSNAPVTQLRCFIEPEAQALPLEPLMYLDTQSHELGELQLETPAAIANALLQAPGFSPNELVLLAPHLKEMAELAELPLPLPAIKASTELLHPKPVPHLRLGVVQRPNHHRHLGPEPVARLSFLYADWQVKSPHEDEIEYRQSEQKITGIVRNLLSEKIFLGQLYGAGLSVYQSYSFNALDLWCLAYPNQMHWHQFFSHHLPALKNQGWQIEVTQDFPMQMHEAKLFDADLIESSQAGWFDVALEIEVEGKKMPLAPLLANAIHQYGRKIFNDLDDAPASQKNELYIPWQEKDHKMHWLSVPRQRLQPLLQLLHEWLDGVGLGKNPDAAKVLRLSRFDLNQIHRLERAGVLANGAHELRQAAQTLSEQGKLPLCQPPKGLRATLRHYQLEGMSWLSFLAQHQLNGLLADDMGLGKTLQTIAFILGEHEAGRLTQPALVVMPTSLVRNWSDEVQRYAPSLKTLALHGAERHAQFAAIPEHQIVLSTYALLPRDIEELSKIDWHVLVLDESQRVKNAKTQAAQALRTLRSRHRVCLSGTPLENHLGELWSQFDFLLPGLLGDDAQFNKRFRVPIEKQNNRERALQLADRIRPFMLRRTKAQVVQELPSKTETLVKIELEGKQRDLYETVRATMDKKLREVIGQQGFARSQILFLDALLKLRQVCCDPQLLKSSKATAGKIHSAKRAALMEMLTELTEEGRKILVFSSFAEMLKLLSKELQEQRIPHNFLIGESTDRAEQVAQFQAGQTSIFLISLKAGGVGLNLTAADTVILYDPWWNPAAEQQAIDRTHRIGQEKPVFVYKLIAAGTVEERILSLQLKKMQLADEVLAGAISDLGLTEQHFNALFAPLD